MFRAAFFLLVGLTGPASAAEWWMITPPSSNPRIVEMGDASSIKGDRILVRLWTHRFYAEPQGRMASALIQHHVDCLDRATKEGRYIDFDADGNTIESGDNSDSDMKAMAPGTVGDLIVSFACESAEYRKKNYVRVDSDVDYRSVAMFFLEPGQLVRTPIE